MSGNNKKYEFEGMLYRGSHGGHYINFPYDTQKEFGTRKPISVKVWFDGHLERKSLLPKGDGTHWISISYEIRKTLGKSDGDMVSVVIEKDDDPRVVPIPEDFEWLLDNEPELKLVFQKQSYYTRKFFCDWITQANNPDVRVSKINRILDWLHLHQSGRKVSPFTNDINPPLEEG